MFNAITKKSITLLMVIVLIFSIGITAFASYDYDEIDYNNFQEDDSDYDNTHETISDYDYVIDDVSDYDHINEDLIIKDYYTATMSSNGPLVSPGAQVVEEIGGSLYVNNIKVQNVNVTVQYFDTSLNRTITNRMVALPGYTVGGILGTGSLRSNNIIYNNVVLVSVSGVRITTTINGVVDLYPPDMIPMFYDMKNNQWIDSADLGFSYPDMTFTQVQVTPNITSVQRGTTSQFSATITNTWGFGLPSGRTWSVERNNSPGTTINSSGLLTVAPNETSSTILIVASSTQANLIPGQPNADGVAIVTLTGPITLPTPVGSATALQNAINSSSTTLATIIQVSDSFSMDGQITIPANRQITLVSTNTSAGSQNERILSQMNEGQRHFIVLGRLTLGQNIILSGGLGNAPSPSLGFNNAMELDEAIQDRIMPELRTRNVEPETSRLEEAFSQYESTNRTTSSSNAVASGGVLVGSGGIFTMNTGSIIENCMNAYGGAIGAWGSGTAASTRATINLSGGIIRDNIALYGGAVDLDGNTRMNMTSGTITGNQVFENGGAIWIGTGTVANGQGFNMTGGNITSNLALGHGGGIFTTHLASGYGNINTGTSTVFSGNQAGWGAVWPPPIANRPAHIKSSSTSIVDHILNNWDIVYWGHLG